MITLQVKRPIRLAVNRSILLHAAQLTMQLLAPNRAADVSIVIGNDVLVKKLNRQYRGVDSTTDVLSFPVGDIDPDTSDEYLGDVVISLPRAQDQAAAEGHPLADELQLLVVHGVLHLLGYDHIKTAEKKQMQAAQDKVMHSLGVEFDISL
jgi:probable rRNA maturation factor